MKTILSTTAAIGLTALLGAPAFAASHGMDMTTLTCAEFSGMEEADRMMAAESMHEAMEADMMSGEMAEGEMAEGEMAEGEMAEGEMAEGEMAEGEMAEGEMADGMDDAATAEILTACEGMDDMTVMEAMAAAME